MFFLAHLTTGLIIGKIFNNYTAALIGALFIDLDHLVPYIKHNIIFDLKKLWRTITDPKDPYGNQRNFLHNFFSWIIISITITIINFKIGFIFSLAYLTHLLLDLFDGSDLYPLYPIKLNFKGPIKYLSSSEIIITLTLFLVFFLI